MGGGKGRAGAHVICSLCCGAAIPVQAGRSLVFLIVEQKRIAHVVDMCNSSRPRKEGIATRSDVVYSSCGRDGAQGERPASSPRRSTWTARHGPMKLGSQSLPPSRKKFKVIRRGEPHVGLLDNEAGIPPAATLLTRTSIPLAARFLPPSHFSQALSRAPSRATE